MYGHCWPDFSLVEPNILLGFIHRAGNNEHGPEIIVSVMDVFVSLVVTRRSSDIL